MARKISDEKIKLSIIIDGNAAQKEILDLEKATIGLKSKLTELNKEEKARRVELEKSQKTYTDQKARLEEASKAFDKVAASADKEAKVLKELEQQHGKSSKQFREQARLVTQLEREAEKLWREQDRLATSVVKAGPGVQKLTAGYNDLKSQINKTTKEIDSNESRLQELTNALKVNEMTMAQLQSRAKQLAPVLRHLVPGSDDYKKYKAELDEITDKIDELKGKGKEAGISIGSLADRFNRFQALGVSIVAMLTGVILTLQKMIDYNGKLADAMTNVRKTTGMNKKEVDELAKSFGNLKTRTGRIELLGIAEVGGRLGIAKEEIADFVRVMDKSAVALGDSFEGGPDVVAEKLGRIKGLYKELRDVGVEDAFESVGSALNDLGADGTASEQNLAEFAQRVGAIPEVFRPSIQTVLGMGAAFEESGLRAEIAGNNYGKVISIAARDVDAFATVMQRPRKELEQLINTDPNEFFLQFASSLKGLDATQLAQVLDYLKLNDNEVKMVLGAASANVQLFRDKINLAGKSMAEATSLTTEYDLKNTNLAATLERLKKTVFGWFSSDTVVDWLTATVDGFAKLIGAVEDNEGAMATFRNSLVFTAKILAICIASILSYTAGTKLATLWSTNLASATTLSNVVFRINYALLIAQEIALKAAALAQALFTLQLGKARTAYQALALAMGMNPFGALVAILAAVVVAFKAFAREADEVAKRQKLLNDLHTEAKKKISAQENELDLLRKTAQNAHLTDDKRIEAIERLNELIPDHIGILTLQNIKTQEGVDILKAHTAELYKNARARAARAKFDELAEKKLDVENKTSKDYESWVDDVFNFALGETDAVKDRSEVRKQAVEILRAAGKVRVNEFGDEVVPKAELEELVKNMMANLGLDKKEAEIAAIDAQMKALEEEVLTDLATGVTKINPEDAGKGGKSKITIPDPDGDKAKKKADDLHKQRLEDLKKQKDALLELSRKAIDERLALMQEGFEKEEAIEAENHRRKIEDLQKQMISPKDIAAADEKIKSPNSTKRDVDFWTKQKETWVEKNKQLNKLIESENWRHELANATIAEKGETKRLVDQNKQFDLETTARETAHNMALEALGNNEKAKAKLQEKFEKEELDRTVAHLKELIEQKENILGDKNSKIDMALLTPEQRADLETEVAELKKKISELVKAKRELQGKYGTDDVNAALGDVFGGADVLGFTADQWAQTFSSIDTLSEKLQAAKMVVGALQNIWGTYNDFLNANEAAQLRTYEKNADAKKRRLKWQLDNGYINQTTYNRNIEALDADLDRKKSEVEYKQAKRQKALAVLSILTNTAQAIIGIWAQVPKYDFGISAGVLTAAVSALGALQLATVLSTPLPAKGYEQGLYRDVEREQDGKIFRSRYGGKTKTGMVHRPTYFLTGENGPEMIIDSKAYRELSPETKEVLWRELRGIKGFENGYYNHHDQRFEVPTPQVSQAVPQSQTVITTEYLLSVINRNSDVMEKIYNEGLIAMISRDPRELRKLMDDMDRIKQSKEKAKN